MTYFYDANKVYNVKDYLKDGLGDFKNLLQAHVFIVNGLGGGVGVDPS